MRVESANDLRIGLDSKGLRLRRQASSGERKRNGHQGRKGGDEESLRAKVGGRHRRRTLRPYNGRSAVDSGVELRACVRHAEGLSQKNVLVAIGVIAGGGELESGVFLRQHHKVRAAELEVPVARPYRHRWNLPARCHMWRRRLGGGRGVRRPQRALASRVPRAAPRDSIERHVPKAVRCPRRR